MKKIALSILITLLSINIVYAQTLPNIDIDRKLSKKRLPTTQDSAELFRESIFNKNIRNLGISGTELAKFNYKFIGESSEDLSEKIVSINRYQIYNVKFVFWGLRISNTYFEEENYVLENGNIIGYSLVQPINLKYSENLSAISQIKSLTINSNYLQGLLSLETKTYPKPVVTFYEQIHDSFIERYAILKLGSMEFLILDSFYPEELEKEMQPRVKIALNKFLKQFNGNSDEP